MNYRQYIRRAKGILVEREKCIQVQRQSRRDAKVYSGPYLDMVGWQGPASQSRLDRMRFQQRYFSVIYAFLRGRRYVLVEPKCRQKPHWARLRETYAVMTGTLPSAEDLRALSAWLYEAYRKERPARVADPVLIAQVMYQLLLHASDCAKTE